MPTAQLKNLTQQTDQNVLQHILAFEFCHGRMPTTDELCFYCSMSPGQLAPRLARLCKAGKLLAVPAGVIPYVPIDPTKQIQAPPAIPQRKP